MSSGVLRNLIGSTNVLADRTILVNFDARLVYTLM